MSKYQQPPTHRLTYTVYINPLTHLPTPTTVPQCIAYRPYMIRISNFPNATAFTSSYISTDIHKHTHTYTHTHTQNYTHTLTYTHKKTNTYTYILPVDSCWHVDLAWREFQNLLHGSALVVWVGFDPHEFWRQGVARLLRARGDVQLQRGWNKHIIKGIFIVEALSHTILRK